MLLGIVLSLVAALAQMSGGLLVLSNPKWPVKWDTTLLALGAGFLLALVFLELIPESFALTNHTEYAVLWMLAGFSALHFFEHTVVEHMHFGEEIHSSTEHSHRSAFGAVGGLTLHAFFDGMSISAAAKAKPELGVLVSIAVLLHKVPEGLTVASVMKAGHHGVRRSQIASLALAAATLIGAVVVYLFVSIDTHMIGYLFAFSAGSSLYVGACDLIPEVNKSRGRMAPLIVFGGMLLFWLGAHLLESILGIH